MSYLNYLMRKHPEYEPFKRQKSRQRKAAGNYSPSPLPPNYCVHSWTGIRCTYYNMLTSPCGWMLPKSQSVSQYAVKRLLRTKVTCSKSNIIEADYVIIGGGSAGCVLANRYGSVVLMNVNVAASCYHTRDNFRFTSTLTTLRTP